MKKLIVFFFSISVFAQDYGNNAETLKLCTTLQTNSFSSNLDADSALDRILEVVGLSKNFVLAPCSDINNAVAVSFKGVRYILYDPDFMSMLSRNTSNWTNLFILAHEVGHHVNGHSLDLVLYAGEIVDAPELKKKREQELEADEFAGFVLAKLGASLTQTTSTVSKLSNEDDTYSTHPKRDRRIESIKVGYKKGEIRNKTVVKSSITINSEPTVKSFSRWKSIIEYPKEILKAKTTNHLDFVSKSKDLYSKKNVSSIEGILLENVSAKWPIPMQKNLNPSVIIEQSKGHAYLNDKIGFFIKNLPEIEMFNELDYDLNRIIIELVIDDSLYSLSLAGTDGIEGFKKRENLVGTLEFYTAMSSDRVGDAKKVLEALKRGYKMYVRVKGIGRPYWRKMVYDFFGCEIYEENCFNTYEFDLKGSSKALSF